MLRRCVVAAFINAAPAVLTATAGAQTIDPISPSAFSRKLPLRTANNQPYWVSHDDCVGDDELTFDIKVRANADQYFLEAWAGTDCAEKENRRADSEACWQLYAQPNTTVSTSVTIRAQTLAERRYGSAPGDLAEIGTAASCEGHNQRESLGLWFALVDPNGNFVATQVWMETTLALNRPLPPTALEIARDGRDVELSWTASTDANRTEYRFFCELLDVDAGAPCPTRLVAGEPPPPRGLTCGGTNPTEVGARLEGIPTNVSIAVAVTTGDEALNVGLLSNVACVGPAAPVAAARNAGCDCGVASRNKGSSVLMLLFCVLALVGARRHLRS